jgi:metal-responsive CopG/Arc/MetJ family transcriptional regulator
VAYESATVKQVLIGLRPDQVARLESICKETGLSRSELVRSAVDAWFKEPREGERHA